MLELMCCAVFVCSRCFFFGDHSPADAVRPVVFNLLAESKVRQLDIPPGIHQNVLRLYISVHQIALVEIPQGARELRCVEGSWPFSHWAISLQQVEELTVLNVLQREVKILLVLERAHKLGRKRRVDGLERPTLVL
jgi:hypothetical protein